TARVPPAIRSRDSKLARPHGEPRANATMTSARSGAARRADVLRALLRLRSPQFTIDAISSSRTRLEPKSVSPVAVGAAASGGAGGAAAAVADGAAKVVADGAASERLKFAASVVKSVRST